MMPTILEKLAHLLNFYYLLSSCKVHVPSWQNLNHMMKSLFFNEIKKIVTFFKNIIYNLSYLEKMNFIIIFNQY